MVRKIVLAALFIIYITALTGCHTLHGVGQDIKNVLENPFEKLQINNKPKTYTRFYET